jgi:hypothetical protein
MFGQFSKGQQPQYITIALFLSDEPRAVRIFTIEDCSFAGPKSIEPGMEAEGPMQTITGVSVDLVFNISASTAGSMTCSFVHGLSFPWFFTSLAETKNNRIVVTQSINAILPNLESDIRFFMSMILWNKCTRFEM